MCCGFLWLPGRGQNEGSRVREVRRAAVKKEPRELDCGICKDYGCGGTQDGRRPDVG